MAWVVDRRYLLLAIAALAVIAFMFVKQPADGQELGVAQPLTSDEVANVQAHDSSTTTNASWQKQIDAIVEEGGSWAQVPDATSGEEPPAHCKAAKADVDVSCAILRAAAENALAPGIYEQADLEQELRAKGYLAEQEASR